jgi:hypothetical protein
MLKTKLTHPGVLATLGPMGMATTISAHIDLNLRPGLVSVTDAAPDGSTPEIYAKFGSLLLGQELKRVECFASCERGRCSEVGLMIATDEARIYAKLRDISRLLHKDRGASRLHSLSNQSPSLILRNQP